MSLQQSCLISGARSGVDDVSDVTTAQLSSLLAESINKPLRLKVLRHSGEQHTLQVRLQHRALCVCQDPGAALFVQEQCML